MIYKEIYFGRKQEKTRIDITQNSNAQTLVFRSMDWEIPSGASTNIFLNKPDGHLVYNSGSVSGNELTFAMTSQMSAVPGVAEGQVQIVTSDEKLLNSFVFDMHIEETIIDGTALESTDEYTALEGLITDATAAIADASDAADDARAAAGEAREPVQVGARNLIVNMLNPSSSAKPKLKGATSASVGSGITATYGNNSLSLSAASAGAYVFAPASESDLYCFEAGEYYYFSFDYAGSGVVTPEYGSFDGSSWTIDSDTLTAATATKHYAKMFQVPSGTVGFYIDLSLAASASIQFSNIQLEKATVPSEYRPATEDITTPLLAAQSQLNNLVVTESKTITTVGNYYILSDKSGYILANAYRVVNDTSGHIKSIAKRSDSGYTLMFDGITTNVTLSIYCVWIKTGA